MTSNRKHVLAALIVPLLTAGCLGGGGGGLFSLFGGSEGGVFSDLFSGGSGGSGDSFASLTESLLPGGGSDGDDIVPGVARVHNPEPASMALFGGGLTGLAMLRRRKSKKQTS